MLADRPTFIFKMNVFLCENQSRLELVICHWHGRSDWCGCQLKLPLCISVWEKMESFLFTIFHDICFYLGYLKNCVVHWCQCVFVCFIKMQAICKWNVCFVYRHVMWIITSVFPLISGILSQCYWALADYMTQPHIQWEYWDYFGELIIN